MNNLTNGKPFIFISYSHRDANVVLPVIRQLRKDGFEVWYDDGIDPGTEWDENIAKHVEGCTAFVAMISKNYIASPNCKDELNYARDLQKGRLLVYIEDVQLPSGLAMRMGRLQALFLYKYEDMSKFYERLETVEDIIKCKNVVNEQPVKSVVAPQPAVTHQPVATPQPVVTHQTVVAPQPVQNNGAPKTFVTPSQPQPVPVQPVTPRPTVIYQQPPVTPVKPQTAVKQKMKLADFALPGFRTKNTAVRIFASIGYFLLVILCGSSAAESGLTFTGLLFMILMPFLFTFNYLNCQKFIKFENVKNSAVRWALRIACIVVIDAGLIMLSGFIL